MNEHAANEHAVNEHASPTGLAEPPASPPRYAVPVRAATLACYVVGAGCSAVLARWDGAALASTEPFPGEAVPEWPGVLVRAAVVVFAPRSPSARQRAVEWVTLSTAVGEEGRAWLTSLLRAHPAPCTLLLYDGDLLSERKALRLLREGGGPVPSPKPRRHERA